MKSREDILILRDGGYFFQDCLDREPKHRAETAFRAWLEEHGQDGETYILAKWLSHEMTINVKRTITSSEPTTAEETPVETQEELNEAASAAAEAVPVDESPFSQEEEPDGFPGKF